MARVVKRIVDISPEEREDIRRAIYFAMRVWPNAGGDETPRENIRAAFKILRDWTVSSGLPTAVGQLEADCYRYEDM